MFSGAFNKEYDVIFAWVEKNVLIKIFSCASTHTNKMMKKLPGHPADNRHSGIIWNFIVFFYTGIYCGDYIKDHTQTGEKYLIVRENNFN